MLVDTHHSYWVCIQCRHLIHGDTRDRGAEGFAVDPSSGETCVCVCVCVCVCLCVCLILTIMRTCGASLIGVALCDPGEMPDRMTRQDSVLLGLRDPRALPAWSDPANRVCVCVCVCVCIYLCVCVCVYVALAVRMRACTSMRESVRVGPCIVSRGLSKRMRFLVVLRLPLVQPCLIAMLRFRMCAATTWNVIYSPSWSTAARYVQYTRVNSLRASEE